MYLIDEQRLHITVCVEGKNLDLTRRANGCDIYDEQAVTADVLEVCRCCNEHIPISSAHGLRLSGTNILRIIDAYCLDDALIGWDTFSRNQRSNGCDSFKTAIMAYLGFAPSSHITSNFKTISASMWHKQTAEYKETEWRNKHYESSGKYEVWKKDSGINNLLTYDINGKEISLCLVGKKYLDDPKSVLNAVINMEKALSERSDEKLKDARDYFGPLGLQRVAYALFASEMVDFFVSKAKEKYIYDRERFYPRALTKKYLGPKSEAIVEVVLSKLESMIPAATQYLINTSKIELMTDKETWKLYKRIGNEAAQHTLYFKWDNQLNCELRDYLRSQVWHLVEAGAPFVREVYSSWEKIAPLLDIIYEQCKIKSMMDLTAAHCLNLQSYLIHQSGYEPITQRKHLLQFRRFYNFVASCKSKVQQLSPMEYIEIPSLNGYTNHVPPIQEDALNYFTGRLQEIKMSVRLAFIIAIVTAARAESICKMQISALKKVGGRYALYLTYPKTLRTNMETGDPIIVPHYIPDELAYALIEYIDSTQDLRDQLEEPYVFVYMAPNLRAGSKRPPKILSSHLFAAEIEKLQPADGFTNEDGTRARCNFMTIRAAVGRALFAAGYTPGQVAAKLGNTPPVAGIHYNTMRARDYAELYHNHYAVAFQSVRSKIEKRQAEQRNVLQLTPVAYGFCTSSTPCQKNNCLSCPHRAIPRGS